MEAYATDRLEAIRSVLQLLRYLGLWPWQDETGVLGSLKRHYGYMLHIPLTFTFIALMWLEAFTSTDLEQAGQVLYMSFTEIALIVKILNVWSVRKEAYSFVNELNTNVVYQFHSEEEVRFWQKQQRFFKRIFYAYIASSYMVVVLSSASVLFQSNYQMPFGYYVPFDWQRPDRYWYAFGYNVVAMSLTCFSNITLDMVGCYFLFHVALLYQLVGKRLDAMNAARPEFLVLEDLKAVFYMHARVFRLSKTCERLVSPYIVAQIVLSAFIICFSGYRLQSSTLNNTGQTLMLITFVSVMIIQIFLPCYYGNEVTYHANRLTNNVYNTNWLHYKPKARKLLILYMEFLKRPVKIQAVNFFDVGLPIFVKTMNNSYTFLALLLNVSK